VIQRGDGFSATADSSGNVFVGGIDWDPVSEAFTSSIVESTAGIWTRIAEFTNSFSIDCDADATGKLYVANEADDGNSWQIARGTWTITAEGKTWAWEEIATFPSTAIGASYRPPQIVVTDAGKIFAAGTTMTSVTVQTKKGSYKQIVYHWLVIRGTDRGDGTWGWDTVADLTSTSPHTEGLDIIASGESVYAAGALNGYWQVIRSGDGGASWIILDSFRLHPDHPSRAQRMAVNSAGELFVVGAGNEKLKSGTKQTWVVRKGAASGTQWSTLDRFSTTAGGHSYASGVTVDSLSGEVFVTGSATDSTSRWVTRKLSPGVGWRTVFHQTTRRSAGYDITSAAGRVVATGFDADQNNSNLWIVRELPVPQ
jgi:hypothetical protein